MSTSGEQLLSGSAAARRAAQSILAESRFHQSSFPRPLHGALVAIGNALDSPLALLQRTVDAVGRDVPGGVTGVWAMLALAVIAVSLVIARGQGRHVLAATASAATTRRQSADDFERAARTAEAEHRLDDAVRLYFRAGLTRLRERSTISAVETTPTAEIAKRLASPTFDALARRFDEIAYGGALAWPSDVEHQRTAWPQILREAPRR